jgi:hypothetical protein
VCYDNINHKVVERKGNLGKAIGGSKGSIVEPNIKKKVRTTIEVHAKEGIETHNSQ